MQMNAVQQGFQRLCLTVITVDDRCHPELAEGLPINVIQ
jgi:hypothetical protein